MGLAHGIGIGIPFKKKSSGSWSSYWTNRLFQDNLNLYSNTRSGLSLINTKGDNASILPAITVCNGTSATTNFQVSANTIWVIRGRYIATTLSKLQGAFLTGNNTRFYFGTNTSGAAKWRFGWGSEANIAGGTTSADTDWHTFIMYDKRMWVLPPDIDISNVNILNIINTETPTVNNSLATWDGTGDVIQYGAVTGSTNINFEYAFSYLGSITDNVITWSLKHVFSGGTPIRCLLSTDNYTAFLSNTTTSYSQYGSSALIDFGYTLWQYTSGIYTYVPNYEDGTENTYDPLFDAVRIGNYAGSLTKYNRAKALINIPITTWDRSNVLIWNDACRASSNYDLNNKNRWHSEELYRWGLLNYSVNRGVSFIKDSIDRNLEIFSYSANLTGESMQKVMQYIYGQHSLTYTLTGSDDYIDWKISDQRILHMDSAKILTYDSENKLILYSENSGVKWYKYEFVDVDYISMSHCFDNGNVLFATRTKIYNTTNKFDTINEITVKDTDGVTDYVKHTPVNANYPGLYFLNVQRYGSFMVDGDELFPFANYTNSVFENGVAPANLYCSKNGVDVIVAYKFGQNPAYRDDGTKDGSQSTGNLLGDVTNSYICRHIHSITRDTSTGKWYLCTGDDARTGSVYENHWIEGERSETGLWTWGNPIVSVGPNSRMKTAGLVYKDGFIYFSSDSTAEPLEFGVYKTTISNIANLANHVKISALTAPSASFLIEGEKMVGRSAIEGNFIFSSNNLVNVHESIITNLPTGYKILGKLDNGSGGYAKFSLMHEDHYPELYKFSRVLLVKVK